MTDNETLVNEIDNFIIYCYEDDEERDNLRDALKEYKDTVLDVTDENNSLKRAEYVLDLKKED